MTKALRVPDYVSNILCPTRWHPPVEREEARGSFKQEALASWAAYQETGRHLTGQEVGTWLNTWGADDERAVPDCHK